MTIQILPPEEARKIAAGEVIDRPASIVRELLDNALDAGSSSIEVAIENGGVKKVEVIDDGCGMGRDDLAVCFLDHATSKIRSLDDLNRSETLGFRGEALAAASAVAALDILSSPDGREAWRLETGPGASHPPRLERARRVKGSSVRCFGLFDTIPARKRFLKRDWSEAALCYQVFTEKALAFPSEAFRFIQDGKVKAALPAASSFKERFAALLLKKNEAEFLHEISASGEGFSVTIVAGGGELARTDRKRQYVFANGRRIQDFSLQQALEYGMQGVFPNGTHPLCAVFIDIAPHLADFNIHPAKREARFSDSGAIHHAITSALRDFSRHLRIASSNTADIALEAGQAEFYAADEDSGAAYQAAAAALSESAGYSAAGAWERTAAERGAVYAPERGEDGAAASALEALLDRARYGNEAASAPRFAPPPGRDGADGGTDAVKLIGRAFDLFIIVEKGEKLYLIDQHAAHERILYEDFINKPIPTQELLVSIPFETESLEDDRFLESRRADLARLGIVIEGGAGNWHVEALPSAWRTGDADTVKAVLELRRAGENIAERWAATLACRAAIKDGGYLDNAASLALARAALSLPDHHCPHGRPIWTEISREGLFRAVKRT
jgi:DNA mismatch repair protein MutL